MKSYGAVTIILITLLSEANTAADCDKDGQYRPFDCAGKGEPYFYETPEGYCMQGCKVDGKILSCEEVHTPPDLPDYKNAACKDKVQIYDCGVRGVPYLYQLEDECSFHCIVEGDMIFSCDMLHPPKADKQ